MKTKDQKNTDRKSTFERKSTSEKKSTVERKSTSENKSTVERKRTSENKSTVERKSTFEKNSTVERISSVPSKKPIPKRISNGSKESDKVYKKKLISNAGLKVKDEVKTVKSNQMVSNIMLLPAQALFYTFS